MAGDFVDGDDEQGDVLDPAEAARRQAEAERLESDAAQKLFAALKSRQEAYRRVFAGAPMPGDATLVQQDLRQFCRGETSAFHENERIHTLLTGRQEVYLRIMDHLRLTHDELLLKYTTPRNED